MDTTLLIGYIGGLLIALVLGYIITNWYHQVTRRVALQEAQLFLIAKMAEQQGIDKEHIYRAFNHTGKKLGSKGSIDFNEL